MTSAMFATRTRDRLCSLLDMDKTLSDDELIELGRQHLVEQELRTLGELRHAAKAELDAHTEKLKKQLLQLQADGRINDTGSRWSQGKLEEKYLADLIGVDRMTIRGWLGKQRSKAARGAAVQVQTHRAWASVEADQHKPSQQLQDGSQYCQKCAERWPCAGSKQRSEDAGVDMEALT